MLTTSTLEGGRRHVGAMYSAKAFNYEYNCYFCCFSARRLLYVHDKLMLTTSTLEGGRRHVGAMYSAKAFNYEYNCYLCCFSARRLLYANIAYKY
jgi:hypothetical protein